MAIELSNRWTKVHGSRLQQYFGNRCCQPLNDGVDLDLMAWQFVAFDTERIRQVRILEAGIAKLAELREIRLQNARPHHALAGRLAKWLRDSGRLTWENTEFRAKDPNAASAEYQNFVRPDVFSIVATLNPARVAPMVHEVKVSRADFLADLAKPSKRVCYSALAGAVYYVAAEGLIRPEEVPDGFGLLVETETGVFNKIKNVRQKPIKLDDRTLLKLVLKPWTGTPDSEIYN
jgi:hypothetical protein